MANYDILGKVIAERNKIAYNLNQRILLLSTVVERVLSTPITN